MYTLGILYREKINNYSKSTGTLESLISKYPNTERKPDALYYLYLNCLDQNDAACSLSYSDKIKYEYPDSRYGKYLTDPESARSEFIKKMRSRQIIRKHMLSMNLESMTMRSISYKRSKVN